MTGNPTAAASPPNTPATDAELATYDVRLRIIVERDPGQPEWAAWFQDVPEFVVRSDEAMRAFDKLLEARRERLPDPYQLRIDARRSKGGRIEVLMFGRRAAPLTCPSCKGTGKYVGLAVVEECETCGGRGQLLD